MLRERTKNPEHQKAQKAPMTASVAAAAVFITHITRNHSIACDAKSIETAAR